MSTDDELSPQGFVHQWLGSGQSQSKPPLLRLLLALLDTLSLCTYLHPG